MKVTIIVSTVAVDGGSDRFIKTYTVYNYATEKQKLFDTVSADFGWDMSDIQKRLDYWDLLADSDTYDFELNLINHIGTTHYGVGKAGLVRSQSLVERLIERYKHLDPDAGKYDLHRRGDPEIRVIAKYSEYNSSNFLHERVVFSNGGSSLYPSGSNKFMSDGSQHHNDLI